MNHKEGVKLEVELEGASEMIKIKEEDQWRLEEILIGNSNVVVYYWTEIEELKRRLRNKKVGYLVLGVEND